MAYGSPLDEGEMFRLNIRSIRKWIDDNKGRIKAKPNETVLYSGRIYDLDVMDKMKKEDRDLFKGSPIYLTIEKHRKLHQDRKLPFHYQTLEDILKTIRGHPVVVDKSRTEQKFSSAFDFFNRLLELAKYLPNSKGVNKESWDRLSEIFASNAVGDIRILDGYADDFGKIAKDKVLLNKELDALLKNTKLSKSAQATLLDKIQKYGKEFDHRYKKVIEQLDQSTRELREGNKRR